MPYSINGDVESTASAKQLDAIRNLYAHAFWEGIRYIMAAHPTAEWQKEMLWYRGDGTAPFGFRWYCDILGLEISAVRAVVNAALRKKGIIA